MPAVYLESQRPEEAGPRWEGWTATAKQGLLEISARGPRAALGEKRLSRKMEKLSHSIILVPHPKRDSGGGARSLHPNVCV